MNGVEVLEEMRKKNPSIKIIMLTGYPTIETARESLALGLPNTASSPLTKKNWRKRWPRSWRHDPCPLLPLFFPMSGVSLFRPGHVVEIGLDKFSGYSTGHGKGEPIPFQKLP